MKVKNTEASIEWTSYSFIKKGRPVGIKKTRVSVLFSPYLLARIKDYAQTSHIGFSAAVERLLDTNEAKNMAPLKRVDWDDLRKAATIKPQANYDLTGFTSPKKRIRRKLKVGTNENGLDKAKKKNGK